MVSDDSVYDRARRIFEQVIDRDAAEQRAVIAASCASEDRAVCSLLLEMLAADARTQHLDTPAIDFDGPPGAAAAERKEPMPAEIGGYPITGLLGEGGMGIVYRAQQRDPERDVALKALRPGVLTASTLARFRHEASALAKLNHPAIAKVFEAGTDNRLVGDRPFIAMELIEGAPITRFAEERGLERRDRLRLLVRVCDAIDHAHRRGVIHRDLKPGNILVDSQGNPKVLDFGIARLTDADVTTTTLHTGAGQLLGTLSYMSPEQVRGDPDAIDSRTDVYSLGVLGYELLGGRHPLPVAGRPIPEAARIICNDEPSGLGTIDRTLRGDVETIIATAIEKEPSRRYQSAAAMRDDIERHLRDEPIVARAPSVAYQWSKFARRNRVLVGGVAGAFALLVLAVAGTSFGLWRANTQRDAAIRAGVQKDEAREAERVAKERAIVEASKARDAQVFLENMITAANPFGRLGVSGPDITLRTVLDRAAEELADYEGDPEVEASLLVTIGSTYGALGAYEDGITLLERASRIADAELGPTSSITVDAHRHLGVSLARLERYEAGRSHLERALSFAEEHHPENGRLIARTRSDLATCYKEIGRLEDASVLTRLAAEYFVNEEDPTPEWVGIAYSNHGLMLARLGDADGAAEAYENALEALPSDNPTVGLVRASYGNLFFAQQQWAEAAAHYESALSTLEGRLNPDHPRLGTVLHNLGAAYNSLGRSGEALPMLERALGISSRSFGEDSADFMYTLREKASAMYRLGMPREAGDAWLRAGRWRCENDPRSPQGPIMLIYAHTTLAELDFEANEAPMIEAYDRLIALVEDDHPYARQCRAYILESYTLAGRAHDAARFAD